MMRGKLLRSTALTLGLVVGLGASGALADVDISATVSKEKNTIISEMITRNKDIRLDVQVMSVAAKFSEALAILNQSGQNTINESQTSRTDTVSGSVNNNSGITVANQSSGSLNNQGSSVSGTANADAAPGGQVYSEAQAAAGQYNSSSVLTASIVTDRTAVIEGSLNENVGVLHANQSVGNMNNQGNGLSLALSFGGGGVVLSDAALGQSNSGHQVSEYAVLRTASMQGSVNTNNGIVGVNQAAGNFANQANLVAVGVALIQ
jgi:hypothetical protein